MLRIAHFTIENPKNKSLWCDKVRILIILLTFSILLVFEAIEVMHFGNSVNFSLSPFFDC